MSQFEKYLAELLGYNCFSKKVNITAYYYVKQTDICKLYNVTIAYENITISILVYPNGGALIGIFRDNQYLGTSILPMSVTIELPNLINKGQGYWASVTKKYDWNKLCLT